MHVFFDDQTFVAQEQGGISRYFSELAIELGRAGVGVSVFGGISRNLYLPSLRDRTNVDLRFRSRRDQLRINTWIARISRWWRRWEFGQARRREPLLIYHATGYDVDPWIAARADITCLTMFDMIAELLCDEASRERSLRLKGQAALLADVILCISSHTRQDFVAQFPGAEPFAIVTPLAASLSPPSAENRAAAAAAGPYFLLVGNRAAYKNGIAGLGAFALLAQQHPAPRLICFGGEVLGREELQLLDQAGVRDRVVPMRGDDPLLAAYYAEAVGLLYPSRYEGFGLPVLEAMQLGCPVITTRCASLPEVAGDAAVYLDPDDVSGMAQAAARLLADPRWRASWVHAGRLRAQQFSWAKTARKTRQAYAQALQGRRGKTRAGAPPRAQACSGVIKQ